MECKKQLYLIDKGIALREEVIPIKNSEETAFIKKPKRETGLWTSTWREDSRDSAWVEWCVGENFWHPYEKDWYLLTPDPSSNLSIIDSVEDLLFLLDQFAWETETQRRLRGVNPTSHLHRYFASIDFEKLASIYDGLWLTERGNAATHLSYPHDLNGWDCESILWFHWRFTHIEQLDISKQRLVVPNV